ncbi:MAG: Fe-Mn family superoxide dismutase [Patescibacteria group bacterium]
MEISEKTKQIHKDKLYAGYVNKAKEVTDKLIALHESKKYEGNATYSELRALKDAETFAVNGVYLHEWYFDVLEGDGDSEKAPELKKAIIEKFGSWDEAINFMTACGMAARGWTVLGWDTKIGKLKHYNADAHNQGGIWGCIPIIVLDVYEHAYFIDFGADRKSYIETYWKTFNWARAEEMYLKVRDLKF